MIRSSIGKQLFQWVKVNTCIKVINMLTNQVKSEGMRIHLNNQSTRRACKNQSNWQSNMKWKRNKVAGMHPAMKLSLKWSNYPAISKKNESNAVHISTVPIQVSFWRTSELASESIAQGIFIMNQSIMEKRGQEEYKLLMLMFCT